MEKQNKRVVNRYFCGILYQEDPNFKLYFDYIKKHYTEVTYITHNRDIDEDGNIKKEHMHILFKVGENAHHLSAVAKAIGIPENYIQGCNKDAMLLYFIHKENPEKTQYEVKEVQGELQAQLQKMVQKSKPEEERYKPIIQAIQDGRIKTLTTLFCYGIGNNCLEEIKRCQYLLCKIIEEKWKPKKEVDKQLHKM